MRIAFRVIKSTRVNKKRVVLGLLFLFVALESVSADYKCISFENEALSSPKPVSF